ncbi:MAG: DUF4239 domain-containing protein [Candidatus Obscuribacterales bacterium]|nr:DUF4239 domain-containing protein [Candidatus Obscuribacterales bacterium]
MQLNLVMSLIMTLLTVLISIAGLLVFRKKLEAEELKEQHEVTDPYSQFVGMLFAVLLGFMVADAMSRFGAARQTVQLEASGVANVFRTAEGLPEDYRKSVRALCLDYCKVVVEDEWPKLKVKKTSDKAWQVYTKLWKCCSDYEPVSAKQTNAQAAMLAAMSSVGDSRRIRADALHNGMPIVLWVILFIGGISTIVFTYFFTTRRVEMQIAMVSIVSIVICLNIFLLSAYDDPFSGDVMITSSIFETQIKLFESELTQGNTDSLHVEE